LTDLRRLNSSRSDASHDASAVALGAVLARFRARNDFALDRPRDLALS